MNKTKKFTGTILMLLLTIMTYAQVSVGIKSGVNYANITTPDLSAIGISGTKYNRSFTFGALVDIPVKNGFSIQPELNFSKKGFEIQENIPLELINIPLPVGIKAVADLKYLELPVLAKYKVSNGIVGGYLNAGPTFSYATGANFKTVANFIIDFNLIDQQFDLDALNVNRFDIGATVGGGATLRAGNSELFFDARYTHGFNKLDNLPVIDLDFKNKNFALTGGILIPLGKKERKGVPRV